MHKIVAVSAILTIAPHTPGSAQSLSLNDRAAVAEAIVEYRQFVFGDNIRWNWCRSPAFWDDKGQFVGKSDVAIVQNVIRDRSNCPKEYKDPARAESLVEVFQHFVKGDSIIVHTAVSKPNIVTVDEYHLFRDKVGSITVRRYVIRGATDRH